MSGITTHILDVSTGKPAAGISVRLEHQADDGGWKNIGSQKTDDDGRARELLGEPLATGSYRLIFDVDSYFEGPSFYKEVTIAFIVNDEEQHYHVPLLLSPFGYSTYRGS